MRVNIFSSNKKFYKEINLYLINNFINFEDFLQNEFDFKDLMEE